MGASILQFWFTIHHENPTAPERMEAIPMSAAPQPAGPDSNRHMLRHALATLAYRGGKTMRGAPNGFAEFRATDSCRTPGQILAHLGDLLDWSLSQAQGAQKWQQSPILPWDEGMKRTIISHRAPRSNSPRKNCFRDRSPMHSPTSAKSPFSGASPALLSTAKTS